MYAQNLLLPLLTEYHRYKCLSEQGCEEAECIHSENYMIFHMKSWTKTFQSLVRIWNQMASQNEEVKYVKYLSTQKKKVK